MKSATTEMNTAVNEKKSNLSNAIAGMNTAVTEMKITVSKAITGMNTAVTQMNASLTEMKSMISVISRLINIKINKNL